MIGLPSDESLGYYRPSLRDEHARIRPLIVAKTGTVPGYTRQAAISAAAPWARRSSATRRPRDSASAGHKTGSGVVSDDVLGEHAAICDMVGDVPLAHDPLQAAISAGQKGDAAHSFAFAGRPRGRKVCWSPRRIAGVLPPVLGTERAAMPRVAHAPPPTPPRSAARSAGRATPGDNKSCAPQFPASFDMSEAK